ncbi:TPA: lipid II flippase MurJ, partial [Bacillus cereus]
MDWSQSSVMKKNIAITAITLMVITLINRFLGFAREFLIAYYFGAGYESDSFFIANTIPNFIATLFISGTLSAAFIPVFMD